jgi:hypothetical protein
MQLGKEGKHTLTINEKTWDVFILWELTKDLPIVEIEVAPLLEAHPEILWFVQGEVEKWVERRMRNHPRRDPEKLRKGFQVHREKVLCADLSYPILMTPDGLVGDGRHRVGRAHMEGKKTISARLMTWEIMQPALIKE